jgi:phage baseplate assembly protein W
MTNENQSFLGRGWSFPPDFDWNNKTVIMSEEEQDIRQSLHILLSTIPGERLMRQDYGCDLHAIIFSRRNQETVHRIIDVVSTAILNHEPRVVVESVEVDMQEMNPEDVACKVYVNYTVIKTNTRNNIVYPFYLIEGTLVTEV